MSSTSEEQQLQQEEEEERTDQGTTVSVELLGGLALLALSAFFLLNAGESLRDWVYPRALGYTIGVIGVYLVIRGLLGRGERVPLVPPLLRGEGVDVAVFTLITIVYVAILRPVGFWISTSLMIAGGATYLDTKLSRRNVIIAVVVAVAVSITAFLLLTRVFYVSVPRARWAPWNQ